MDANTAYQPDKNKLCVDKMNFAIINCHPKLSNKNQDIVKREIEKMLFRVFEKYVDNI